MGNAKQIAQDHLELARRYSLSLSTAGVAGLAGSSLPLNGSRVPQWPASLGK